MAYCIKCGHSPLAHLRGPCVTCRITPTPAEIEANYSRARWQYEHGARGRKLARMKLIRDNRKARQAASEDFVVQRRQGG